MSLFVPGDVTLASGSVSHWKLECDALTEADWAVLARLATERLPSFKAVEGVPRGGLAFAAALAAYARPDGELDLLVADDVWTTGGSITSHLLGRAAGVPQETGAVVAFARNPPPAQHGTVLPVVALWTLAPEWA